MASFRVSFSVFMLEIVNSFVISCLLLVFDFITACFNVDCMLSVPRIILSSAHAFLSILVYFILVL